MRPCLAEGGRDVVVGYSVGLPHPSGTTIFFGGGSVAKDLWLPPLRQFWEASPASTRPAIPAWRGQLLADSRDIWQVSSMEWSRRAAAAIDQAYDALKVIPSNDYALWASVAREMAGIDTAWSRRVEGDKPGPLARAADALALSAQVPPGTPSPVRAPIRGFQGAAMVVAQGNVSPEDRGRGWALLLGQ